MADREGLLALALRVEQASGPDREIDALIAPLQSLRIVDEWHPLGRRCYDVHGHGVPLPSYNASLDAAMGLVPEGWSIQLSDWDHPKLRERGPWQAILVPLGKRGDLQHTFDARCDHAATPALALTAAALRARAQMETDHAKS